MTFTFRYFKCSLLFVALLFTATQLYGACGTDRIIKHIQEVRANPGLGRTMVSRPPTNCPAEAYYQKVHNRTSTHFQVFYTLDGPHKTTEAFVDTAIFHLEKAWTFHTGILGMRTPLGFDSSYHYKEPVQNNLYPVEIIEIDMVRNTYNVLGSDGCYGCFGLTLPDFDHGTDRTELVLDNDFRYTAEREPTIDSVEWEKGYCAYPVSTFELKNKTHNYSYADKWEKALQITAPHELYHGVQLRYMNYLDYPSFWFEASATGIEETVAPEVNDYLSYLSKAFSVYSVGQPLDLIQPSYGVSPLFLYLYNHVDKKFDKSIWESYSQKKGTPFTDILQAYLSKKELDPDSVFHDYAIRVSQSGRRSSHLDSALWINMDQPLWPDMSYTTKHNDPFKPDTTPFAYKFYTNQYPNFEGYKGKSSAILYQGDQASIKPVSFTNTIDSIRTMVANGSVDSIAWIFSRLGKSNAVPTQIKDSTLRAYPTPWRKGNLCFTPLPQNKKFLEIRNRRGSLVMVEKYSGLTHCIDEQKVKEKLKPGLYHFRAGNSGKTKELLIIY